jgi:D-xylonolactonase
MDEQPGSGPAAHSAEGGSGGFGWRVADATRCTLGEGPLWVTADDGADRGAHGALWWVDIKAPAIHRLDPIVGKCTSFPMEIPVTALAPRENGGMIAATGEGLAWFDPIVGRLEDFTDPEPDRPGNRFNDGKLDPAGRFWAGTMDDAEEEATGALYRVEGPDRRATLVDDGYRVTNGPAFSPDGRVMYHTDSGRQVVYRFGLDVNGGVVSRSVFREFRELRDTPDGMTVDSSGCLWIAFWDSGSLRRLSPDGAILAEVSLPVPRATSCCFGGPALDRLFVTTARVGLSDEVLAAHPLAGCLLEVTGHGASGVPLARYRG